MAAYGPPALKTIPAWNPTFVAPFPSAKIQLQWTIDTFLDARNGYFFEMNPLGAMADALMGVNGQNRARDGIWNARVQRSEIGWTLEIALPFRTFNFNPNSDTWGINFERSVSRKNEQSLWSGWAHNQGLQPMTNAGLVTGIRNVTQGRGLDLKPYGVFTSQASPGRGKPSMKGEADAGDRPLLQSHSTAARQLHVNTDFAQTEVDQRQVNLTRYSLFFPEQRDFFLDGATFLDFGSDRGQGDGDFFGGGGGGDDDHPAVGFLSRRASRCRLAPCTTSRGTGSGAGRPTDGCSPSSRVSRRGISIRAAARSDR